MPELIDLPLYARLLVMVAGGGAVIFLILSLTGNILRRGKNIFSKPDVVSPSFQIKVVPGRGDEDEAKESLDMTLLFAPQDSVSADLPETLSVSDGKPQTSSSAVEHPAPPAELRARLALDQFHHHSLPAMPAIAQKILALPLNTEEGEAQLLRLIAQDPLISAKLIGLANSPVHGLSRRVNAVADAAALFGISKVKAVAIGIASLSTMSKLPAGKNFKPQDLWIHSMVIAIAMQAIAKAMPPDLRPKEDQIFLAGLLHDMGYMALHFLDARLSDELHLQLRLQPDRPVLELERELLGITHCDIGAHLARHWNLPAEIVDVLGHHHPPLDAATDGQKLTSLIALAEKLQPNFGLIENTGTVIATHEWDALGINLADIEEIHSRVNETVIQLGQMGDVFR